MGWLWSSPPSKKPSNDSAEASPSAPAPASSTRQTDSEYSDPEIVKLMVQFRTDFGASSSEEPAPPATSEHAKTISNTDTASKPASSSSWGSTLWGSSSPKSDTQEGQSARPASTDIPQDVPLPTGSSSSSGGGSGNEDEDEARLDPIAESLLPNTMSCRTAFDAAYYCNGLGSQFLSVYREGGLKDCSQHWDDFWFCMRTRTFTDKMKAEAIRNHYRKKELSKYGLGKPSSENVWEARTELLPVDSAFRAPYPNMDDVSDEDLRMYQVQRRKQTQEALERERQ